MSGLEVAANAAVACVSHKATAALNSVGAAPGRFQLDDQSASEMLAQPAKAIETKTTRWRIDFSRVHGCQDGGRAWPQWALQQRTFPLARGKSTPNHRQILALDQL